MRFEEFDLEIIVDFFKKDKYEELRLPKILNISRIVILKRTLNGISNL